jgi:hypothetical protein
MSAKNRILYGIAFQSVINKKKVVFSHYLKKNVKFIFVNKILTLNSH